MKRTVLTVATALIGFAAAAAAETLEANIPFSFQIGSMTLPAGTYLVNPAGSNRVTSLRSAENGKSFVLATPIVGSKSETARLTFTHDGSAYQLTEVCSTGSCLSNSRHKRIPAAAPLQVATVALSRPRI